MSVAEVFFDSNVLLYLFSPDITKAERAEELIGRGGTVSVQALNEFASVARRRVGLEFAEIREALHAIRSGCRVLSLDIEIHELGLDIAEHYRFSLYDSMIVAAALRAECRVLYSEDMQHDQKIERMLTIRNPFRDIT